MRGAILTHVRLHVAFLQNMKRLYCVVIDSSMSISWAELCSVQANGRALPSNWRKRLRLYMDNGESSPRYLFPPMHVILANPRPLYTVLAVSQPVPD